MADPATTTTQIKRISDVTAASRSEARTDLSSSSVTAQSTNEGGWGLSNSDSTLDAKLMNRNNANNPVVSALVDADGDAVPAGFNPNHAVGTNSNNYPWGQCTWYAYQRRAELGLPSSGNFGNGGAWAASASALAIGWTTLLAMSVMLWCSLLPGRCRWRVRPCCRSGKDQCRRLH